MDRPRRRKLLVASVGIATVSYALVACGKDRSVSGNLPAPPPPDTVPVTGNLPAPPPMDAGATPAPTTPTTATTTADAGAAPKK